MDNQDFDVREYVKQMSTLLDLQIKAEYEDEVVKNFTNIQALANLVNSFPLPENVEPISIFQP
ncbi:MAG TPA: DUF4089 domain-containing protein [Nostocaceae cyanobacterium]|nr:DUF4089 domain-containing protein [Nostocaceae cyanobacterium]